MGKVLSFFFAVGLLAAPASGASRFLDDAQLRECDGRVELRESEDNLHLQFRDVYDCENLIIKNESGKVLKQYGFRKGGTRPPYSPNYTISKQMWQELGRGDLLILVTGPRARDEVTLSVRKHDPSQCGGHSSSNFTGFALTNSCKCAFYRNGQFIREANLAEEFLYCPL